MKYEATGSNILEMAALALGKVPLPAIDSLLPLIKTRAIMSGVRLGIFEALRDGERDAAQIAECCCIGLGGVSFLLRTLAWAGYLDCAPENRYLLSRLARESMLTNSPKSMVGFVRWNSEVWSMLTRLDDCLQAGKGLDFHHHLTDPNLWADYQRAMLEGARFAEAL